MDDMTEGEEYVARAYGKRLNDERDRADDFLKRLRAAEARNVRFAHGLIEREAELIYLRKYGADGGRWELVETKDVWRAEARAALNATDLA